MITDTAPDYLATLATSQTCAILQRAAQDTLSGVASGPIRLSMVGRRPVSAAEVITASKNVLTELQFERPLDIHHSVLLMADATDLARLFALSDELEVSGELDADALLRLGDIVSSIV